MRNRIYSGHFILLMTFFCFHYAPAQVPRTISYQGILTDTNGNYISDGNHSLRLTMYDDSTNGTPVYSETQAVAVVKGLFSVIIGSITPIPSSLTFDKAYYLGIIVDNGPELLPRTALTSVPYSLHAETADVAKSLSPTAPNVVTHVNGQSGEITLQGVGSTSITQKGSVIEISSTGGGGSGIQGVQNTDATLNIQDGNGPVATIGVADNGITTVQLSNGSVTGEKINTSGAQTGQVMTFNGTNAAWSDPTGGSAGVSSVNNITGPVILKGGGGTTVTSNGNSLMITAPGGGGTGIQGVQNTDGSLAISNPNGPTASVNIASGGVTASKLADNAVTASKISTASVASSGKVLTATANGMDWQTPSGGGGLTLPYSATDTQAADLFTLIQKGKGHAMSLQVDNTTSSNAALMVTSNAKSGAVPVIYALRSKSIWNPGLWCGVLGESDDGQGIVGFSNSSIGVTGASKSWHGIAGETQAGNCAGVVGMSDAGPGYGVWGQSTSPGSYGVYGSSYSGTAGAFKILEPGNSSDGLSTSTAGTGRAGFFAITNSANAKPALEVTTNGTGDGIYGSSSGHNGVAGTSTSITENGVFGGNDNGGNGVMGRTTASGSGVFGLNLGTGYAGRFMISNASNNLSALYGTTNGVGHAAYFENTNSSSLGTVVYAANNGGGNVFGGTNSGTGSAASFFISNSSNSNDVLIIGTNGTGDCLKVNHTGASGNLAVFKNGNVNKARIDKTGKGFFNGGTQNSGADLAEAFGVEGNRNDYEPGDVLVISATADRRVEKCDNAYSTRVIGVYATKPGVLLTDTDIESDISQRVPLGVVGVIPTKVCLQNGPIHRGDLLVCSSLKGYAMKGTEKDKMLGAIIGKALEDFVTGEKGKINVMVNVK